MKEDNSTLTKKIDFALIINVKNANPNGDPLNINRPRTDYNGFGEISDVCLKRKMRDRLMENGHEIFVQSDDHKNDKFTDLKSRAESILKDMTNRDETKTKACSTWFDVRAFGQIFPFKGKSTKKSTKNTNDSEDNAEGISIAIRGPVTIQSAFTVEPIDNKITSIQITKSVNLEGGNKKKESDTMGMKHRVDQAIYVVYGAMTPQLAERTGFSDNDAEIIKELLPKLFEGDASSARPEGSMSVEKVFWWKHNSKSGQYSSAKVHQTLKVNPDGTFDNELIKSLAGLKPEIIPGF